MFVAHHLIDRCIKDLIPGVIKSVSARAAANQLTFLLAVATKMGYKTASPWKLWCHETILAAICFARWDSCVCPLGLRRIGGGANSNDGKNHWHGQGPKQSADRARASDCGEPGNKSPARCLHRDRWSLRCATAAPGPVSRHRQRIRLLVRGFRAGDSRAYSDHHR